MTPGVPNEEDHLRLRAREYRWDSRATPSAPTFSSGLMGRHGPFALAVSSDRRTQKGPESGRGEWRLTLSGYLRPGETSTNEKDKSKRK